MLTVLKPDERIISFLKQNELRNLNILGFLQNHSDARVLIFDNNIANGIIVANAENDMFLFDTKNTAFLECFWKSLKSGEMTFSGVPDDIAEPFMQGKKLLWRNKCKTYILTGKLEDIDVSEYAGDSLTVSDAPEIDAHYTYKSDHSLEHITDCIKRRSSECIRINGGLAAWATVHDDNSMGILYVKEEHRGKGLAKIITVRLAEKQLKKNIIPYGQIVHDNLSSLKAISKIRGFEFTHSCSWFGLKK